jgi:hypothetical protein
MRKTKINTYLACITTEATNEQWSTLYKFLEFKKQYVEEVICITSSGRETYSLINDIIASLEKKSIPHTIFGLASKAEPDIKATHSRIETVLATVHKKKGLLLISEIPLADVFAHIQGALSFIDDDALDEPQNNEDQLDKFMLSIKENPNMIIYDAHSLQFIK